MKKLILALGCACLMTPVHAGTVSISLADIPAAIADTDQGAVGSLPAILNIVDDYYTDGDFSYEVFPFARSIGNAASGRMDAHAPLIDTGEGTQPEFQYVDEPLVQVTFVVYSHKDSPVTKDQGFDGLNVETMNGHAHFFEFPVTEVNSIEGGLKKVEAGRIDAFIMEQDAVDALLRASGSTSIHRELYATWDAGLIVQNGADGDALNSDLSAAIRSAKQDPKYQEAAHNMHSPFNDWQPHQ